MSELTELDVPATMDLDAHREADHEATQEDHHEGERPESPRDAMMKEIARRREEAIARELSFGEDLADEARARGGHEPLAKEAPVVEEPDEQPEEPQVREPARPELRKVVIDGHTFEVTQEQYDSLAEMGARANIVLSQQQQYAAYHQQQARQAQPAPAQNVQERPVAPADGLSKEEAEQVAERLLYGGKEDVAKTVQELAANLTARAKNNVNSEQVAALAAQRARAELQLQQDLTTLAAEYPTIMADRTLGELAALQLNHVRHEDQAVGRTRTNLEAYREACDRVLNTIGQPRTQASAQPHAQAPKASDRSQVQDRKRAAPSQPAPIGRRASDAAPRRAPTGSEIVAQMRRSRGQLAY